MAARIRSKRNGIDPVDELSRNDLASGDLVSVESIDGATTYKWTLVFVPEGSAAVFSGTDTNVSPGSFSLDLAGPYLVRLVVDAGLGTESVQYVRLRALTTTLSLKLVAAGERRDSTGTIPVDADIEGWANEQNENLLALEAAVAAATSTLGTLSYNKNVPAVANDSVSYRGWASVSCQLIGVRVRMMTVHTVGNYTLAVVNEGTGNTVLLTDPTSLNTLVDGVVTPVPMTAVASDLLFASLDGWRVTLTSDAPGFDGTDIYFELVWNTATAGGPVVEDLATTLLVGNITGGTNIEFTAGDVAQFGSSPAAVVAPATTGRIRYNQPSSSFQFSVDGGAWREMSANDDHSISMAVSPGNTINELLFAPYDLTVLEINAYCDSGAVSAAGTYTLAVADADLANNLLAGATFDMETSGSLPAATLTSVPLTATTANLNLAKGTKIQFALASDNADLVASGVYLQIIYRSQ